MKKLQVEFSKIHMEIIEKSKTSFKFWNNSFDKNRLKTFVCWFLKTYGEKKTIELLEQLKNLGFGYATQAGVSLGIDDLLIPKEKMELLYSSNKMVLKNNSKYKNARITAVEKIQLFIDTWNQTSENLKKEVINNFEKTNIFNPVYMMAFSGARGNISQVRQLVGMRGLMSDPQGNIIDFPIQSNFREGLTLTEYLISTYGARKGIVDTALRTATAGYLTRRLVDVAQHVMISLFDCKTTRGIFLFDMKEGNRTLYSFQNRLIGRVLATDIKIMNNLVFLPPSALAQGPPHIYIGGLGHKKEGGSLGGQPLFLGFRNQEISTSLATKIAEITKKAFVRSPLTCQSSKFICQLCYGWSLSSNKLVSLGEAVGVIAAQSIGEPGTQLTMRTFHTGGVFSGGLTESVIANYDGWIEYLEPIPGTCIRTLQGKIAFLTKAQSSFVLKKSNNGHALGPLTPLTPQRGVRGVRGWVGQQPLPLTHPQRGKESSASATPTEISFHKIPGYAILFARHKQKIFKKQIIAQFSSVAQNPTNMKTQKGNAEQTVYADLEGEIFLNQIDLLEQKSNNFSEDTLWKSYSKSKIWILSGKIYQNVILAHKDLNKFLVQTGDFVHKNSVFQRICWYNSHTNYIQFLTNFQKIFLLSNIAKKKALAHSAYATTRLGQDISPPRAPLRGVRPNLFFSSPFLTPRGAIGGNLSVLPPFGEPPCLTPQLPPNPPIGLGVTQARKGKEEEIGIKSSSKSIIKKIHKQKIYSVSITNLKNSFSHFYSGLAFSSVSKTNLAKKKILALYRNVHKWPEKKAEKLKTWILKSYKNKAIANLPLGTKPNLSRGHIRLHSFPSLTPRVKKGSMATKLNSVLLVKNINFYKKNKWFKFTACALPPTGVRGRLDKSDKFKIIQTSLSCNLAASTGVEFLDFKSVVNGKNLQIKIPYIYQYNNNFRSTLKKKYNRMNYRANKKFSLKLKNFNKGSRGLTPHRGVRSAAKRMWPIDRLGLPPTGIRGKLTANFSNKQKLIPNFFKKTSLQYKTQQKRVVFRNSKLNLFENNIRKGINTLRILNKAKEWKRRDPWVMVDKGSSPNPPSGGNGERKEVAYIYSGRGNWRGSGVAKVMNKFSTTKVHTMNAIHIAIRSNDSTKILKFSSFLKNPNSFYKIKNFKKNFIGLDYFLPSTSLYGIPFSASSPANPPNVHWGGPWALRVRARYLAQPNPLFASYPLTLRKGVRGRSASARKGSPFPQTYSNPPLGEQEREVRGVREENGGNNLKKFSFNKKFFNKFDKFSKFHLKNSSEKFLKIPILFLPLTKISFQSLSYVFHLKKNSFKKIVPLQNDKILSYLPLNPRKLTKNQKTLNMISPNPRSVLQWFCSDSKTEPGLFIHSKKYRKWNLKNDFWIQKKRSNYLKKKISRPSLRLPPRAPLWGVSKGNRFIAQPKPLLIDPSLTPLYIYGGVTGGLGSDSAPKNMKEGIVGKAIYIAEHNQRKNSNQILFQDFRSLNSKTFGFIKSAKNHEFLRFAGLPTNQTFPIIKPRFTNKFAIYMTKKQNLNKFSVSTQIFQSIVQKNYKFHRIQKTSDNFLYRDEYRSPILPISQTSSKVMMYLVNPQGKKKLVHSKFSGLVNFSEKSFPFFHFQYSTTLNQNKQVGSIQTNKISSNLRSFVKTSYTTSLQKNSQIHNKKTKKDLPIDYSALSFTSQLSPVEELGVRREVLLSLPPLTPHRGVTEGLGGEEAQEGAMFFMPCLPKTPLPPCPSNPPLTPYGGKGNTCAERQTHRATKSQLKNTNSFILNSELKNFLVKNLKNKFRKKFLIRKNFKKNIVNILNKNSSVPLRALGPPFICLTPLTPQRGVRSAPANKGVGQLIYSPKAGEEVFLAQTKMKRFFTCLPYLKQISQPSKFKEQIQSLYDTNKQKQVKSLDKSKNSAIKFLGKKNYLFYSTKLDISMKPGWIYVFTNMSQCVQEIGSSFDLDIFTEKGNKEETGSQPLCSPKPFARLARPQGPPVGGLGAHSFNECAPWSTAKNSRIFHYHQIFFDSGKKCIDDIHFEQNSVYIENCHTYMTPVRGFEKGGLEGGNRPSYALVTPLCLRSAHVRGVSNGSMRIKGNDGLDQNNSPTLVWRQKTQICYLKNKKFVFPENKVRQTLKLTNQKIFKNKKCRYLIYKPELEDSIRQLSLLIRPVFSKILPNSFSYKNLIYEANKTWTHMQSSVELIKDYHSNLLNKQVSSPRFFSSFASFDFKISKIALSSNQKKAFWFNYQKKNSNLKQTFYSKKFSHICGLNLTEKFKKTMNQTLSTGLSKKNVSNIRLKLLKNLIKKYLILNSLCLEKSYIHVLSSPNPFTPSLMRVAQPKGVTSALPLTPPTGGLGVRGGLGDKSDQFNQLFNNQVKHVKLKFETKYLIKKNFFRSSNMNTSYTKFFSSSFQLKNSLNKNFYSNFPTATIQINSKNENLNEFKLFFKNPNVALLTPQSGAPQIGRAPYLPPTGVRGIRGLWEHRGSNPLVVPSPQGPPHIYIGGLGEDPPFIYGGVTGTKYRLQALSNQTVTKFTKKLLKNFLIENIYSLPSLKWSLLKKAAYLGNQRLFYSYNSQENQVSLKNFSVANPPVIPLRGVRGPWGQTIYNPSPLGSKGGNYMEKLKKPYFSFKNSFLFYKFNLVLKNQVFASTDILSPFLGEFVQPLFSISGAPLMLLPLTPRRGVRGVTGGLSAGKKATQKDSAMLPNPSLGDNFERVAMPELPLPPKGGLGEERRRNEVEAGKRNKSATFNEWKESQVKNQKTYRHRRIARSARPEGSRENGWWNNGDFKHEMNHKVFLTKKDMFSILIPRFESFSSVPFTYSVKQQRKSRKQTYTNILPKILQLNLNENGHLLSCLVWRSTRGNPSDLPKATAPLIFPLCAGGLGEEVQAHQTNPPNVHWGGKGMNATKRQVRKGGLAGPLGGQLISSVSLFNNYEISQKQQKYHLSLKKLFLFTRNISSHPIANNKNLQEFQIQKFLTKYQKRLYKLKGLSIGKPNKCAKLCLGNFVLKGDLLNPATSFHKTGQIIHLNSQKITLRYAQCFLISANGILHVHQADPIFQNAPIFTLPFDTLTTGDIVQGIPKVEQYLEARTTQNGRPFLYSLSILLQGIFKRYCTKFTLQQAVSQSFLKIQLIIVDGVQRVYRSQGVSIADKHLEVIVKQMTSKVQIIHGGQTGFFPGELVELEVIEHINPFLMIQIQYEPVVLGITRASLEVESFLSAASFQQTTKILAKASLYKKKDFLKGLKENILIGNLIPAGTGYMNVL